MEFRVRKNNKFRTRLVFDHEGEMKYQKQFYNGGNVHIDVMGGVLFLHTSVPNLIYGTSLIEYDPIHAEIVKNRLNRELAVAGVVLDERFKDFTLSRVDISKNIIVSQNIHCYLTLLSSYSYPRRNRIFYNSDTLAFSNSQQTLLIYQGFRL